MDDRTRSILESMSRRQFLCGSIGSLTMMQGCGPNELDQVKGITESLTTQFQGDYTGYGYQSYLSKIFEKIDTGAIRGGLRNEDAFRVDGLSDFRRAWGIEERYEVDYSSLSLESHDLRVDDKKITRMSFNLDCGFPVIALAGGGEKGTVLLLHGMGTTPERSMGFRSPDYMRQIGRRLMHQGYTVVCPFFPHAGNFLSVAKLGLHLAANGIAFHNVWIMSVLGCLDVALKQLSTEPVYCYGVSMGALIGLHASLFDNRIKALVLSGLVREEGPLLRQGVYDDMLKQGEIYPTLFNPHAWRFDLVKTLTLWAPRPLFIEVGNGDAMSGVAQGRDRVLAIIQDYYAGKGVARNFEFQIFSGGHEAHGEVSLTWLKSFD